MKTQRGTRRASWAWVLGLSLLLSWTAGAQEPLPRSWMMDLTGCPAEECLTLFWVSRMVPSNGECVTPTGGVWTYTDWEYVVDPKEGQRLVRFPKKAWRKQAAPLIWEELEWVRNRIRTSGFLDLPSELRTFDGVVVDGTDVRMEARLDGRSHRVHYVVGPGSDRTPVSRLEQEISSVTSRAWERFLRDHGQPNRYDEMPLESLALDGKL